MMRRSAALRAFLFLALAAACSDSTGPRTAPVPVLTSVSPNAAMTITVTGKDFLRESIVYWNHFALATTWTDGLAFLMRTSCSSSAARSWRREGGWENTV